MLDALYTQRYWDYLTTFIVHGLVDRFIGTGPTENAPNVAGNPMFDLLGIRYVLYADETGNRPPEWSGTQYRPVFESDGVTVYENTLARTTRSSCMTSIESTMPMPPWRSSSRVSGRTFPRVDQG